MISPYRIFGIEEDAPEAEVESAYKLLRGRLNPTKFPEDSAAQEQAMRATASLKRAFNTIMEKAAREGYQEARRTVEFELPKGVIRPRLGQLCVTSGIISMDQLEEAVKAQLTEGIPLGEVLQARQLLSQEELDGLLMGQDLIDVPGECKDPVGLRLLGLNVVSEEMIQIAMMEQKRTLESSMQEILLRHGWVEPEILQAIFEFESAG